MLSSRRLLSSFSKTLRKKLLQAIRLSSHSRCVMQQDPPDYATTLSVLSIACLSPSNSLKMSLSGAYKKYKEADAGQKSTHEVAAHRNHYRTSAIHSPASTINTSSQSCRCLAGVSGQHHPRPCHTHLRESGEEVIKGLVHSVREKKPRNIFLCASHEPKHRVSRDVKEIDGVICETWIRA